MAKSKKIIVKNILIRYVAKNNDDFISLTDIARYKDKERRIISCKTGCEIEVLLNFWVFGKKSIIQILTPSNSMGLKAKLDPIAFL